MDSADGGERSSVSVVAAGSTTASSSSLRAVLRDPLKDLSKRSD